jgi:hypothetical protein
MEDYAAKFINNLPDNLINIKSPIRLDVVLEGGLFNGSFHAGVLFFLKEMENRNIVKVERISGASIGSLMAFLYFSNNLNMSSDLYNLIYATFKKTHNLKIIKELNKLVKDNLLENICDIVDKRLYISYYNVITGKKNVKKTYANTDVLINTIIKSCFVPYLIDGNMLYENKYVDGINPYIFKRSKYKKILYVDLFGYDKLFHFYNIKNEKSNEHRMLAGLLDIHNFFIKQQSTCMCSYVDNWNIMHNLSYCIKRFFEKLCVYVIIIFARVKHMLPLHIKASIIYKIVSTIISKILPDMLVLLLDTYCI